MARHAGIPALVVLSLAIVVACTTISVAAPAASARPSAASPRLSAASASATVHPTATPATETGSPEPAQPSASLAASPSPLTPSPSPLTPSPSPLTASLAPTASLAASLAPTPSPSPPTPSPSPLTGVAAATPSSAPLGPLTALDKRARRKIDAVVSNWVKNKGVAGISVAVGLPGGATWTSVAGQAEFTPPRKVEEETVFAIASVTKTFIAALILQLAEEGKLSLDDTFGLYEPVAPRGNRVTIRQLLSHTSGIYNYFENRKYLQVFRARDHRWTYEEILELVKPGYCKPGTCYHYSNTNYVILGKVAEAAGRAPLHELLRDRFFEPLGMSDTYYQPDDVPPLSAAHGHWPLASGGHVDHTKGARVIPFMSAASVASSAGAIASTASDLATWARALYGGRVLERSSLREMTTFLPEGTYGLGTDVAVFARRRAVGHRGGLRGFESSMWYFPTEDVSIVLLSNQGNWFTDVPFARIAKAVFRGR